MHMNNTNPVNIVERRLRLLITRELASRGHYLDAERLYEDMAVHSLSADELALLGEVAFGIDDVKLARQRLERLIEVDATHPSVGVLLDGIAERSEPWVQMQTALYAPRFRVWAFAVAWLATLALAFIVGAFWR